MIGVLRCFLQDIIWKGALLIAALVMALSGCAVSYIDSDGRHNVIGFVNVSMDRADSLQCKAGDRVEVTNVGVLFSYGQIHSGLSVGYTKESTNYIKNNVLILTDELGGSNESGTH